MEHFVHRLTHKGNPNGSAVFRTNDQNKALKIAKDEALIRKKMMGADYGVFDNTKTKIWSTETLSVPQTEENRIAV